MTQPRRFAEGTEVSAERSRAELEALLKKHGATEFAVYVNEERTQLVYRLKGRLVRHVVTKPPAADYGRDPTYTWKRRPAAQVAKLQEAEWRRRWRSCVLIVKAKLELVASGDTTFEREFMADMLLSNGETMADAMLPRIDEMYRTGDMPTLLLGPGEQ